MKARLLLLASLLFCCFGFPANARDTQRIGHTTLLPRNSNPDDKGMYTALIDPTNGYAYFIGTYLWKVDITGNLPVLVAPPLNTGQASESAIDLAAGYLYLARNSLFRYSLGIGANPVTSAGALALSAGPVSSVVIDDSDPNPTNHYAYVLCAVSGSPAKVTKVALSTFTELGSISLNAGETNFWFGRADAKKGYAYFESFPNATPGNQPVVVKIKMTPGTNPPVRVGALTLDAASTFVDDAAIDTVHGYAYYGTYDSDTNVLSKVYKVKLENGDVPPTLVGSINLKPGEGRLAASVIDPQAGFLYIANDNSYPGGVYRFNVNGTNLPVEIAYLPFPGGTSPTNPPNGQTAANTTTNADGALPFGEVYFRSAVFDPVRGCAYFGQDSRPNQIVKLQLAHVDPMTLSSAKIHPGGSFQFAFTNIAGATFSVLSTTNLPLPLTNWDVNSGVTEISPGQYQFTNSLPVGSNRFYLIRSP